MRSAALEAADLEPYEPATTPEVGGILGEDFQLVASASDTQDLANRVRVGRGVGAKVHVIMDGKSRAGREGKGRGANRGRIGRVPGGFVFGEPSGEDPSGVGHGRRSNGGNNLLLRSEAALESIVGGLYFES